MVAITIPNHGIAHKRVAVFRSSLISQRVKERRISDPDWWQAAREVGTYISRVAIPNPACTNIEWGSKHQLSVVN